jgi:hypothetical protein
MASIITADTGAVSGTAGLKSSADSSGVLALATGTGTTAVTIDASQNVGIGTTPATWATYKAVQVGSTGSWASGANFNILSNGWYYDGTDRYLTTGQAVSQYYQNSGTHIWRTAASGTAGNAISFAESMRIDSSGNLLVGGTANPNSGRIASNVANSARFMSFVNNSNSAEIGYIQNNSGTAVIYSTSSDYRLKDNPQPMVGALDKVAQLKPCTYTWKSTGAQGQGFIAHELQAVVPDAVCGVKDEVNEDGNPVYQGIDTSFLVATLTAAIQEQQALITTLTERITALEAK